MQNLGYEHTLKMCCVEKKKRYQNEKKNFSLFYILVNKIAHSKTLKKSRQPYSWTSKLPLAFQ